MNKEEKVISLPLAKKLKAKIENLATDCDVGSWTWHDSMDNILEEFISKLIHQTKREERERILKKLPEDKYYPRYSMPEANKHNELLKQIKDIIS